VDVALPTLVGSCPGAVGRPSVANEPRARCEAKATAAASPSIPLFQLVDVPYKGMRALDGKAAVESMP